MEEKTNKVKRKFRGRSRKVSTKWRPGDYFKQLSVVIIGIVVTFSGSSLLERIEIRRQIRQTAQLLHAELADNLAQLDAMHDFTSQDYRIYKTFVDHYLDRVDRIPPDSVWRIYTVLTHSNTFRYRKNALETMKSSVAVQEIKDREIVLDIFDCYDKLERTFGWCAGLYDRKSDAVLDFYHTLDREAIEKLFDQNDPFEAIEAMAADKTMYNYIRNFNGQAISLIRNCETVREKVRSTVGMLEREFGIIPETASATE